MQPDFVDGVSASRPQTPGLASMTADGRAPSSSTPVGEHRARSAYPAALRVVGDHDDGLPLFTGASLQYWAVPVREGARRFVGSITCGRDQRPRDHDRCCWRTGELAPGWWVRRSVIPGVDDLSEPRDSGLKRQFQRQYVLLTVRVEAG